MSTKLTAKIPRKVYLAFSGGVDSVFALNFLLNGKRDVHLLHFNHGTEHSGVFEEFVRDNYSHLPLTVGRSDGKLTSEADFREARYEFLDGFLDRRVVLAHHLNDVAEWRLFSFIRNGNASSIPAVRGNYIRPFLNFSRERIVGMVENSDLLFINDPSNDDTRFSRNLIRHELLPLVERLNPGFVGSCSVG